MRSSTLRRCFFPLCILLLVVLSQWSFSARYNLVDWRSLTMENSEKSKPHTYTKHYFDNSNNNNNNSNSVSCDLLIDGDKTEMAKAGQLMKKQFRRSYLPETYTSLADNCSSYVTTRGFINSTVDKGEELFPLAFSIIVFKHIEQVERLLRAIWRPHNLYCIHVDIKSPAGFKQAIKTISKCFDNVIVHPKPISVVWGTFSVLQPELLCMESLLKHSKKWKYFINLTGQEFPLKTNYELYRILKAYNGANDIEGTYKRATKHRWKKAGTPPHGIQPRKGNLHIAATRGFVDYVIHNKAAQDFLAWTKKTSIPDETLFATLNYNPHLKVPGSYTGDVDDGRREDFLVRYVVWYDKRRCGGKISNSVCIFSVGDLPRLTTTEHMFANKFHYDYDYLAYDCLDQWYHNKVARETLGHLDFNTTLYSNRWIVKHHFT